MNISRPYKAVWIRHSKKAIPLLPLRGLLFLLALLITFAVVAFLVEKELALLATKGRVASQAWAIDNALINRDNYAKIGNSQSNPLFRSLGYVPPIAKGGRRRILVLGDSFIWGDGLTNINITWWRQLQWELERRGYRDVDVLAAGVNGASTQDQFNWLTSGGLIEQIKPDAIVFGYVTNDPQMKDANGKDLVKQMSGDSYSALQSSRFGRLFPHLAFELSARIGKKREREPNDEIGYPYGLWELKILEGENFREYKMLLARLAKTIDTSSIPTFFVTTPNAPNAESFEARYAPIRIAFKDAGIRLVDLLPPLIECCSNNAGQLIWSVNPANGHPGPRMTQFYASNVADILEKDYAQALGPRSKEEQKFMPKINDWFPASLSPKQISLGEWELNAQMNRSQLLSMPVESPHFALNFERPVSIQEIHLQGGGENDEYRLWATILDEQGNYELRDYVSIGKRRGSQVRFLVSPELSGKRITSLRISVATGQSGSREIAVLDSAKISAAEGKAYHFQLSGVTESSDSVDAPSRSKLVMLEDGKVLYQAHSLHEDIRKQGNGRYSHWKDGILFSASDNSDPRSNGRRYSVGTISNTAETIRIGIKFNAKAVRL